MPVAISMMSALTGIVRTINLAFFDLPLHSQFLKYPNSWT